MNLLRSRCYDDIMLSSRKDSMLLLSIQSETWQFRWTRSRHVGILFKFRWVVGMICSFVQLWKFSYEYSLAVFIQKMLALWRERDVSDELDDDTMTCLCTKM